MKIPVLNQEGTEVKKKELPKQFDEDVRPDLIYRAVITVQANKRQPYGADPRAGMKASTKLSRRRRDWKTSYGAGMARTPRKSLSRRGTRFNYVGALAPNTVGGRRAHPPKIARIWEKKLNTKERRKAICSALAATLDKKTVLSRGHIVPEKFPFIVSEDIQSISKTKDVIKFLFALGLKAELDRTAVKTQRAGKGKNRARPFKVKKSVLFVVSEKCALNKSAANVSGIEIVTPDHLNAELLAPGTKPGRLTIYTDGAVDKIAGLFKY